MERFVQLIVAGGLALVAGLWIATLESWTTPSGLGGVVLATAGTVALAAGIRREVDW